MIQELEIQYGFQNRENVNCYVCKGKKDKYMNEIERTNEYFKQKFHCSQAVFAAFAPNYGITPVQALKIAGCFGSGMCRGEVCGAVTGALMVLGLAYGQSDVNDLVSRQKESQLTCEFMDRFKEENGSILCKELLGHDVSIKEEVDKIAEKGLFTTFCPKMVESAACILKDILDRERRAGETVTK